MDGIILKVDYYLIIKLTMAYARNWQRAKGKVFQFWVNKIMTIKIFGIGNFCIVTVQFGGATVLTVWLGFSCSGNICNVESIYGNTWFIRACSIQHFEILHTRRGNGLASDYDMHLFAITGIVLITSS